jgi:hypothetical protein
MADLSFNVNYAKPQTTSLGDMVNMASGMQNFQQAQQLNPLELEKKQIENQVLRQKNDERLKLQEFTSNPDNWQTNGRIDMDKINAVIPKIAPLTGSDVISSLSGLSKSQTDATKAKNAMTQDMRQVVAGRLGILGRMGIDDPQLIVGELDRLKKENPDSREVHDLIEAYKVPLKQAKRGPDVTKDLISQEQSLLSPESKESLNTKITTDQQGRTLLTTQSVAGSTPTATVGVAQGLQNTPQQGGGNTSQNPMVGNMSLRYPVRNASQPYSPEPTEAADQTAGQEYRNRLVEAQGGLAQGRRNTDEVIQQANKIGNELYFAKGGVAGQIEQKIRTAIGSEQYDMLAKDLANMALSNTKAMGGVGNTVAGLDMAQVAGGTIKVPPEVLIKIARRVQADQTNLDMQANGAQQFAQKFGDNNMKAFQQAWNANARDTKIFEAMNLLEKESNPDKLKTEFEKLFPSAEKRKTILKQYKNLKSLAATGVVADKLED